MKANLLSILFIITVLTFNQKARATEGHLRFVENKGQISDQFHNPRHDINYVVAAQKFTCHLKNTGFSYQLFEETGGPETPVRPIDRYKRRNEQQGKINFYRLDLNWLNSNPNVQTVRGDELPGYDNYYLTVCPKGVTHVKSFSAITYRNIYAGIDMKWYELNGQLKYDYYVRAGADYKHIQWEIKGAERLQLTTHGELIIETPLGKLVEEAPLVFQDGKKLFATWKLSGNIISFDVQGADPNKDLIIDPLVRAWGTYYGSTGYDELSYTHVDRFNNLYITGATSSATSLNIATVGSHQSTYGGTAFGWNQGDAMLIKMNSNGVRQWSTYYGGSNGESAGGCSSDSQGNVYLVGYTSSSNAGVISTPGSYQQTLMASSSSTPASDVFIAKFTASGIRQWATYYGDSLYDWSNGISVDKFDNVFISGGTEFVSNNSTRFATSGCHQNFHRGGNMDCFLAQFSSTGARLWGTYYGGEGMDNAYYCAADSLGNVYITGITSSTMALTIASANTHQTAYAGGMGDGFLAKFSPTGVRLWSTYYGDHSEDYGLSCAVDHVNEVVLVGTTDSFLGTNFGTSGAHQPSYGGGNSEAFVAKFTAAGVRRWGTYYGGVGYEESGIGCVSKTGDIYICGRSSIGSGTAVATCGAYQNIHGGTNDCFVAHFDTLGKRQWGTFFGGGGDEPTWSALSVDANNTIYLAGMARATTASSIMTTSGAHQTTYGGGSNDLFIERFDACVTTPPTLASGSVACIGQQAVLQNSTSCLAKWFSDPLLQNQVHSGSTYSFTILTTSTTIYYTDESCGFNTSAEVVLNASPSPTVSIVTGDTHICAGETTTLTPTGASTYSWTSYLEQGDLTVSPKVTTSYTVAGFSSQGCKSTSTVQIVVDACAGINGIIKDNVFRFYPNPVTGYAKIEVDENSGFSLYNTNGEIIWQEKTVEGLTQHDFSNVSAGIYFGEIRTSSTAQRFKIVVTK